MTYTLLLPGSSTEEDARILVESISEALPEPDKDPFWELFFAGL